MSDWDAMGETVPPSKVADDEQSQSQSGHLAERPESLQRSEAAELSGLCDAQSQLGSIDAWQAIAAEVSHPMLVLTIDSLTC